MTAFENISYSVKRFFRKLRYLRNLSFFLFGLGSLAMTLLFFGGHRSALFFLGAFLPSILAYVLYLVLGACKVPRPEMRHLLDFLSKAGSKIKKEIRSPSFMDTGY